MKSLDYARHNIYHAPTAINGQQALLDFADVHASAVTPVACMEAGRTNVELSEDISGVSASPYPDADISEIGDQCLSLANNVKGHPPKIRQLEPHSKLGSPTSLENNIGRSTENISESDSHLSVSEDIVTTLEARVRELEQQNQDLEAETGLSNENKELITKVYDRKLEELEVERNKLLLSNRSLDYSNRQTQIFLAEEQKRSRSDLEFKDSHIQLLYVDREALQSKVDELLSKVSEISDAASRQPSLSSNDMSAKDEELAEARVKIGALDSTATELQAKLQELQAKQEVTESALREAQTEAWTKKHLHEELCRTLELSKQMHKEANESNRDLALKLARLEALYKMSRQVSERLLADSWQASATKDERIRILSITAPVPELVQRLDDKQSELHNVECRLIATQRLVETLYNQVKDAKAKHTDIEIENQKLECQLGEAKVRLDHDYQEEERLKAELENATAELEQSRKDGDNWQRLAIESLDDYTPNSVEQVKDATLATMQKKIDEFEHQNKELSGYNATLETCLNDLEYELLINEKRLTMDESIKIDFYERHWRTVEEVFVDNKLKSAMIKGLEARFSEDLAKEPLAQPEVSSETFEEHVGPEFIDRTNAFYRLIGEAQEDLEKMTPVAPILTHRKS